MLLITCIRVHFIHANDFLILFTLILSDIITVHDTRYVKEMLGYIKIIVDAFANLSSINLIGGEKNLNLISYLSLCIRIIYSITNSD